MSEQNNMPVPDFGDEDAQAVQAAQNALQSGRNKPLTVPGSAPEPGLAPARSRVGGKTACASSTSPCGAR